MSFLSKLVPQAVTNFITGSKPGDLVPVTVFGGSPTATLMGLPAGTQSVPKWPKKAEMGIRLPSGQVALYYYTGYTTFKGSVFVTHNFKFWRYANVGEDLTYVNMYPDVNVL